MSLNCVPIVARLRQKLGVAMVSRFAFYAILGVAIGVAICSEVSRFLKRCDRMSRLWTECRTFVGYIRMILMYRDTWRQNRDTFFRIKRHRDTFATLQVSRCFGQLEALIPMLLGDRSSLFTNRDTSPDFLAQNKKINIFNPYSCRDPILPYFRHN
jgi:hypothetical protein